MKNRIFLISKKSGMLIDLFFITLIFLCPLTLNIFFHFSFNEIRTSVIITLAIWMLCKAFISRINFTYLSILDIGVSCLVTYTLFHFHFYSNASFFYPALWIYIGYILIFYMFRWAFSTKNKSNFIIHFILLLIVSICVVESIIGLFQYFDIIEVKNEYFKLQGSFKSPNFYGVYLGFGFTILVWYLFVIKIPRYIFLAPAVLCLTLFTCLIILSNSRGSWLAIIGSLIILLITSKKSKRLLKKLTVSKIIIGFLLIATSLFFGSKFLYSIKPESVKGRIFTTQITLQEISKQPLKGHGLFSFGGKYNKAKADYFMTETRAWDEMKAGTYVFTAFNDYLLIAFELGVLVLIVMLSLGVFVVVKSKTTPETRIGLALFVSLCIFALFNSPLNSLYVMSVGLFGFAVLVRFGGLQLSFFKPPLALKNGIRLLVFIIGFLGIAATSNKAINDKKFKKYSTLKDSTSIKELIHLSKVAEDNFFSEFVLGKKLYDNSYKEEGFAHMEMAFQKSSAPRIGKRLAYCYMKEGNYKRAKEIFKFNINVEPYRYEARMDLLSLLIRSNCYGEVVELSQEIVDFPVKIPSEKISDYKKNASKKIKIYSRYVNSIPKLKGSLSKGKIIMSTILNKKLPYKIYLPPIKKINKKLPVIYINDGYNYINKGKLPQILDSLIVNNIISPVAAIFLEPREKNMDQKTVRQELFLCNPNFVDFFTKELIPEIEKKYPVSNDKNDRAILGISFGGLAAAYIATRAPNYFKYVAMQSPAFHPCKEIYTHYLKNPIQDFKMYMSYGTGKDTEEQDIPMINILKKKGYDLKVERIENGDHTWSVWKEQIDDILIYFYK